MVKITSKNNPKIIEAAKLKSIKRRKESGRFLIEGIKVAEMALLSGYEVTELFFDEEKADNFADVLRLSDQRKIKAVSISSNVAEKLAFGKTTQGVFAEAKMKSYNISEAEGSLIIALEDLMDPGNMGTIIRTADAIGVKSVILSNGCVDTYNDKVIRASMGSVFNVKTILSGEFIKDLSALKEKEYNLACGHLDGEDFFNRQKHEKNILIIGNEARGISAGASDICQSRWKLPMQGGAESLNAAVAAGIMMYDIIRSGK